MTGEVRMTQRERIEALMSILSLDPLSRIEGVPCPICSAPVDVRCQDHVDGLIRGRTCPGRIETWMRIRNVRASWSQAPGANAREGGARPSSPESPRPDPALVRLAVLFTNAAELGQGLYLTRADVGRLAQQPIFRQLAAGASGGTFTDHLVDCDVGGRDG